MAETLACPLGKLMPGATSSAKFAADHNRPNPALSPLTPTEPVMTAEATIKAVVRADTSAR